uniref:Uncharacterized protein n=1 Tax=Arundo donax TaxID=35708 RepID=A0A0A9S8J0_ARUDO
MSQGRKRKESESDYPRHGSILPFTNMRKTTDLLRVNHGDELR